MKEAEDRHAGQAIRGARLDIGAHHRRADLDQNFARAARNLPGIDVLPQQGANVYDIMRRDTLVVTRDAVQHLEARLK